MKSFAGSYETAANCLLSLMAGSPNMADSRFIS